LCASQGMDFARTLTRQKAFHAGEGTEAAYRFVRKNIKHLGRDRVLYDDIQTALGIVSDGSIIHAVEQRIGTLE
jgi:histidine ammonia-lyase